MEDNRPLALPSTGEVINVATNEEIGPEKKAEKTDREKLDDLLLVQKTKGLGAAGQLAKRRLEKSIKAKLKGNTQFQEMMEHFKKQRQKQAKYFRNEMKAVEKAVGKENMKMLRDLFTVQVPEKKDDEGKVVRKATSYVNKTGLLQEARHVIVVEREARIKNKKRKRSTGRSKERSGHAAHLRFINKRNAVEAINVAKE